MAMAYDGPWPVFGVDGWEWDCLSLGVGSNTPGKVWSVAIQVPYTDEDCAFFARFQITSLVPVWWRHSNREVVIASGYVDSMMWMGDVLLVSWRCWVE